MEFETWLAANEFDAGTLTAKQKAALQAQWRAEVRGSSSGTTDEPAVQRPKPAADEPKPEASPSDDYTAAVAEVKAENARQDGIKAVASQALKMWEGNSAKCNQITELAAAALANKKTSKRDLEYQLITVAHRADAPFGYAPTKPQVTDEVVEAAVCIAHRLPGVEQKFDERTLSAAHKHFPRGVTLKKLMLMGARANGYRGDEDNYRGVFRANGFSPARGVGPDYDHRADVGVSTGVQVPGILGNTANKFLAANFMNVEQAWRGIAKIRSVSDFKQITTYRMGGNNTFLRVAPSGEIKHGALSETSYTNQAKTYGRLLGISREDYINDDLGAFITVTQELGRGAADALNNIFWATWLNDSNFFNTDGSKLNYDAGATDSVLSLAGLDNAESIFAVQTKPDGTPLGATPKILLVPVALKNTALTLMQSQITNMATSSVALTGNANIYAGRYNVVASAFLSRTALNDENGVSQSVSGSSTAWYLLADPMDIPCIEVAFLFGKDTPTVETDEFEFDRLGLATRAYFDFGVALQEYRGGVKLKGAA